MSKDIRRKELYIIGDNIRSARYHGICLCGLIQSNASSGADTQTDVIGISGGIYYINDVLLG